MLRRYPATIIVFGLPIVRSTSQGAKRHVLQYQLLLFKDMIEYACMSELVSVINPLSLCECRVSSSHYPPVQKHRREKCVSVCVLFYIL